MLVSSLVLVGVLAAAVVNDGGLARPWEIYVTPDCGRATVANIWLHLAINALSTVVIASVFQMDRRMDDFHVTIAAESFLGGGSYFPPGASLLTDEMIQYKTGYSSSYGLPPELQRILGARNGSADEATAAARTAAQDSRWKRLETGECMALYGSKNCAGLSHYGDLVIVTEGTGWKRADIWNLSLAANTTWEPIVPAQELNSLWTSTHCSMKGIIQGYTAVCMNDCRNVSPGEPVSAELPIPGRGNWNATRYYLGAATVPPGFPPLYCLAESRDAECTVVISKALLLAVVVSISAKVLTCVMVVLVLGSEESLVTPGDAIASFISVQDRTASVPGLVSQHVIRMRKQGFKERGVKIYESLEPKPWTGKHHRKVSGSPGDVTLTHWVLSNAIFIIVSKGTYYVQQDGSQSHWEPEWKGAKGYKSDPANLPDGASIVIGTSSLPVLLLVILLIVMMVFPFALSWRPLPGYMPIVGSNSMAMAAACRVSPLAKVPGDLTGASDTEGVELDEIIPSANEDARAQSGDKLEGPKDMALHPLKWGEVEMPEEWYLEEGENGARSDRMGHLSFGTVLDDPQPPIEGRIYR
ncbi:hypothetical protein CSOJ01_15228 [Colletotrichum sojae]|uniref:Uncharacterized protein n=1 Tax=Colletotrichum sojae TaxID=2175907 RepID=A0A8H6INJ4_9PEZI|nr:hypothetical protein CSOJ01_15228 [Colletotrichum sojae]